MTALVLDGGIPVVCATASRSRFRVEVSEQQDPNPASICWLWGKGPQAQGSRRRSEEGLFFSIHTPTPLSTWVGRRDLRKKADISRAASCESGERKSAEIVYENRSRSCQLEESTRIRRSIRIRRTPTVRREDTDRRSILSVCM